MRSTIGVDIGVACIDECKRVHAAAVDGGSLRHSPVGTPAAVDCADAAIMWQAVASSHQPAAGSQLPAASSQQQQQQEEAAAAAASSTLNLTAQWAGKRSRCNVGNGAALNQRTSLGACECAPPPCRAEWSNHSQ